MCSTENQLSSSTTLSRWAANGLSPLMSAERHLKNTPAEKTRSRLPSLSLFVTNKAGKKGGELQVIVVINVESK